MIDVYDLFRRLGLRPPSSVHIFAGEFNTEGFQVSYGNVATTAQECTCCECYFHIGPPGCDGSNCRRCGRC